MKITLLRKSHASELVKPLTKGNNTLSRQELAVVLKKKKARKNLILKSTMYGLFGGIALMWIYARSVENKFYENEAKARIAVKDSFNMSPQEFEQLEKRVINQNLMWKSAKDSLAKVKSAAKNIHPKL